MSAFFRPFGINGLRALLRSFAPEKNITLFNSIDSALFGKNPRVGVGVPMLRNLLLFLRCQIKLPQAGSEGCLLARRDGRARSDRSSPSSSLRGPRGG